MRWPALLPLLVACAVLSLAAPARAEPEAPRSPRLLEPALTHCGVALVEQAMGQHFLVIMLAEATR